MIVLNDKWRVTEHRQFMHNDGYNSDKIYWVWFLEYKSPNYRDEWVRSVSCMKRSVLLRHIKERCGPIDVTVWRILNALPTYLSDKYHPGVKPPSRIF